MSKTNNLTDFLTDIADTIRFNDGTTATINPQNFSSRIALGTKTITPTESVQTFYAYSGDSVYGYKQVQVNAISSTYVGSGIALRTKDSVTSSGATVTIPAGYYSSQVTYTISSGAASTPATTLSTSDGISISGATVTISKSITPTVKAGYISVGTAGTVSGSATIPSGTISTGTTDQTSYTQNTTAIVPAGGYLYIGAGYYPDTQISLSTLIPDDTSYTNAGNDQIRKNYEAYSTTGAKLIGTISDYTPSTTYFTDTNTGYGVVTGYTYVNSATKYIIKNVGTIGLSANTGGSSVAAISNVNSMNVMSSVVGTAGTDYWQVKATATGVAGSVTPQYAVTTSGWLNGSVTGSATSVSVSDDTTGKSIYIPKATTEVSGASVKVTSSGGGYVANSTTLGTVASGSATTPATTITANPGTPTWNSSTSKYVISVSKEQNVTPTVSTGYVTAGTAGKITVSGSSSLAQSTFTSGTVPSGSKSVELAYNTTYVLAAGYYPDARYYTTQADRYDSGYSAAETDFEPTSSTLSNAGALSVKNAAGTEVYTETFTNSYNAGVNSVTISTLGYTAETALSGSLSGTTYTVSTPQTKGAHTSKLTLGVSPTTLGLISETALSGGKDSSAYTYTVKTPQTSGYHTSQLTKTVSPTDCGLSTATALSKSGGTVSFAAYTYSTSILSATVTASDLGLTALAATTYTPGTTDQTIASNYYTTGTQTIKGDANLVASNIASGVKIFGVTGSATLASAYTYNTSTAATIDVDDLTITPKALSGSWDATNKKYVVSQASTTGTMQSTVTTGGYIDSTHGTKNTGTATVSAPSNLNISQAVLSGAAASCTATTTVAPGSVTIASNSSTITNKTAISSTPTTATNFSATYFIAVKANAAANSDGTTSSISGSGTVSTTTSGYAYAGTTSATFTAGGTATAKTSSKDSSVYYLPITAGSVSADSIALTTVTDASYGQYINIAKGYITKDVTYLVPSDRYTTGYNAAKVGTAGAAQVLTGYTFTNSSSVGADGTMTNNGAVTSTISTQNGTYTIPAGYHNGSGKVTATLSTSTYTTSTTSSGTSVATVTPSTSVQYVNVTAGYTAARYVKVNAITQKTFSGNVVASSVTKSTTYIKVTAASSSNTDTYLADDGNGGTITCYDKCSCSFYMIHRGSTTSTGNVGTSLATITAGSSYSRYIGANTVNGTTSAVFISVVPYQYSMVQYNNSTSATTGNSQTLNYPTCESIARYNTTYSSVYGGITHPKPKLTIALYVNNSAVKSITVECSSISASIVYDNVDGTSTVDWSLSYMD